jgi:hypothetical protein
VGEFEAASARVAQFAGNAADGQMKRGEQVRLLSFLKERLYGNAD